MREDWTREDSARALAQGWDVFDTGDRLEIERDDEAAIFEGDEQAIAFVEARAASGDALAIKALEVVKP